MRYTPRRPQASPLYRVLADHFETLTHVHEERYEPTHGPLRPVVAEVVGRFLDCGLLEHGRLRAYFLYDGRRLGLLSRVAYRTLHAYVGAALGEPDVVPGVISLAQSFGSLAHWHPHLHLVVTDGAFRRDGCFVGIPAHDAAVLTEAWRRAVLKRFVRQGWWRRTPRPRC